MWTQIVGKVRLSQTPWINHSWHVPLYLTARGLTTSPIPYGGRSFQIDFDFIDHRLLIQTNDGLTRTMVLEPRTVADFYEELFRTLTEFGLDLMINLGGHLKTGHVSTGQNRPWGGARDRVSLAIRADLPQG
jgi:hypothetical protein